jgi:hypothetical protein
VATTIVAALAGTMGCVVHTPPARGLPLETAAGVGDGRTGMQLEGTRAGDHLATAGALRLRRGLDERTDLSVEGTAIQIPRSSPDKPTDQDLNTWGLRAGAKHRLSRALAITGGAGAGLFPGGPFVAPDGGLIASWSNGILEPFAAARVSVSLPLESRHVVEDGSLKVPVRAWYYGPSAGVRLPIGWTAPKPGELRGALLAGVSYTWITQDRLSFATTSFAAYAFAGELTF